MLTRYYRAKGLGPNDGWVYFMKFNLFDEFFAQWDRVLYIDAG